MKINLYSIVMFWQKIGSKYEAIKADSQKREKDVSLGVQSLFMSIGGMLLTIVFAFFAYKCFTAMGGTSGSGANSLAGMGLAAIFILIGGVICAFIAGISFIYAVLASIVYAYYQCKLNKNKIGIISLIVSTLLSVVTIALVVIVLSKVPAPK